MKRILGLCSLLALFCVLSSNEALATTRRVPVDFPTIQQAINAAVNGDTVLVAAGTYVENINFLGKTITVTSEAGPQVTIIDGNHLDSVVTFNTGETLSSTLQGFTIRNGFASFFSGHGGGITVAAASPTIKDNVIANNESMFWGGGIAVVEPSNCLITGNKIMNNKAQDSGAGIVSYFASPIIEHNIITNNTEARSGGGVQIGGNSHAIVRYNFISHNTASFYGGGIQLNSSGAAKILNNVITLNTSPLGGGIALVNGNPDTVVSTNLIYQNTAAVGGGLSWSNPPDTVVANTIADNIAQEASGLFAEGFVGNPKVVNNVITGKTGQSVIKCNYFGFPPPNPVFRFNNVYGLQATVWAGDCPDQTGINGNISADPLFVNPAAGDYHLRSSSPSIDTGDNSAPNLPATDLDGKPRIQDGNGDGVAVIDMGAYEFFVPFDTCIQDDSSGSILQINTTTGEYQFTNCSGFTISGTGSLTKRGSTITLQHTASERRVMAKIDGGINKATASIQVLSQGLSFTLTDRNTANNSCSCR